MSNIVGDLINFRGVVYAPVNEQGVVFLFGRVGKITAGFYFLNKSVTYH